MNHSGGEKTNERIVEELADTRLRLDVALEAGQIATWVWDINNDKVYADSNLQKFFGISDEDTQGGPIAHYIQAIHPDDRARVGASIEKSLASSDRYEAEYRLTNEGQERWILARGRIERDSNGQPQRLPGVVLDITDRKSAEFKLNLSERNRRLALDAAELGTFNIDIATSFMLTDSRFKAIFGCCADELSYESALAMIHPDDRDRIINAVLAATRPIDPVPYSQEYRVCHADGSIHWVAATGRTNFEQRGAERIPVSFDGTVADITEKKHLAEELVRTLGAERAARAEAERQGRMKDEFLSTLSHEIRTPLNAILGWSQIIQAPKDPVDLAEGLAVIERNARAQSQIIEDLLDMSRIVSGKVRLDVQRIDLAAIVEASVRSARPTADAKNIRLHSVIDPLQGVVVTGDMSRIQQVLWNMLTNALKFTPKGGRVQVLLERVNSHLEISVIDNGEGIPSEFLPFVFDRFRQSDGTTTRRHGGLGLGLSIVKQLVELHGGTIRVNSSGLGKGSTFVVSLPLTIIHESELEITRVHPTKGLARVALIDDCKNIRGVKVIVLDDEADARSLIKRLLEDCGAVVTAAESVAQTLSSVQTGDFDVLVSDVGMPGEDGYSLIRKVRALPSTRGGNIPAIALTAYARAEDRVKAISSGFNMHLSKPVEPIELITMVASAVGRTGRASKE